MTQPSPTPNASATIVSSFDRPVPLHRLVYLPERDEVTLGRVDVDSYCVVGPDTAEVVRRLEGGATPHAVAAWYEAEHGERLDLEHLLAALHELGFVRLGDEAPMAAGPVRWRRLGAAAFSLPAWLVYAALIAWALLATVRNPDLMPNYHHLFFTGYFAVMEVVLFLAAVPLLLLHECFHALAGRRLGLRSRLTIGHRLYFLVLETSLDGLVAVPRRRRYLPILAGMLADLVVLAALTIVADLTRDASGSFSFGGRLCLAVAMTVWLRVAWQFSVYLRTDVYVLVSTVLGCVDLHATAIQLLRNRVNRLLGRRDRLIDESMWHRADRRAARWYSWLLCVGYVISIGTLVLVGGPTLVYMTIAIGGRFTGGDHATWSQLLDSSVVVAFLVLQLVVVGWIAFRERRRGRRRVNHITA
jgi:hypothetical protein